MSWRLRDHKRKKAQVMSSQLGFTVIPMGEGVFALQQDDEGAMQCLIITHDEVVALLQKITPTGTPEGTDEGVKHSQQV